MPKVLKPPKEDSNLKAADITSRRALLGIIAAAVIASLTAISTATLNSCGLFTKPALSRFTGRVINENSKEKIRGAKVILEDESAPPITYTDAEGIFSFPLTTPNNEIHLWIEATGYKIFDLRIVPAKSSGNQEIHLTPDNQTPEPKASPGAALVTQEPRKGGMIKRQQSAGRTGKTEASIVCGVVRDRSGNAISGARVSLAGTELSTTTNETGNFIIRTNLDLGQRVVINVSKRGFKAPPPKLHLTGEHPATITLEEEK